MKKINNILSSLVFVSTIFGCTGVEENNEINTDFSEKIVFESNENMLMNVDSKLSEDTPVNLLVKLNYNDFNITKFKNEEERKKYFKKAKNYYSCMNNKILENMKLDDFNYYSSLYSPYVSIDITSEELSKNNYHLLNYLDNNSNVEMVYVSNIQNNIPNLEGAKYYTGVRPYVVNGTYTGDNVVVGVLEPGILDVNHENFVNTDVTVRNEWYYVETVSEHTTMMGSIIAGSRGIAPQCRLLSVELYGDAVSEMDWLLDNGVNVVNLSYGDTTPTGQYSSKSAYMDYIINAYRITIVASSGNTGEDDGYVANPGLGYNVLTVGACSSSSSYASIFSSYKELNGPRKPNILAPGYSMNLIPFSGTQNGTSLSAAVTTGCIALMMDMNSNYKYYPERVISKIMASSKDASSAYFENGLDDHAGAGSLNFGKLVEEGNSDFITGFSNTDNVRSSTVNLTVGDKFKLAAVWLAKADGTASNTQRTNYDINIFDSNNNLITSQGTNVDCVELIEFEAPYTDTYTIEVRKNSTQVNEVEYVSVAYYIL